LVNIINQLSAKGGNADALRRHDDVEGQYIICISYITPWPLHAWRTQHPSFASSITFSVRLFVHIGHVTNRGGSNPLLIPEQWNPWSPMNFKTKFYNVAEG